MEWKSLGRYVQLHARKKIDTNWLLWSHCRLLSTSVTATEIATERLGSHCEEGLQKNALKLQALNEKTISSVISNRAFWVIHVTIAKSFSPLSCVNNWTLLSFSWMPQWNDYFLTWYYASFKVRGWIVNTDSCTQKSPRDTEKLSKIEMFSNISSLFH